MICMFDHAESFNLTTLDNLDRWNISNVVNMQVTETNIEELLEEVSSITEL